MFCKTVNEKLSLGEKILLIILLFIFFSPFSDIFDTFCDFGPIGISYAVHALHNLSYSGSTILLFLAGFIISAISIIFRLKFRKIIGPRYRFIIRTVLFIFLPGAITAFLIYGLVIFKNNFFINLVHYARINLDWISPGEILGFVGWSLVVATVRIIAYVIIPVMVLWLWMKNFKIKVPFAKFLYSAFVTYPIFYIGIPAEIGDRFFGNFLIGDILYSVLIIGWIAILIKALQNLVRENRQKTQVNMVVTAMLATFTVLYYVISGIVLLRMQPFQRKLMFEIIIFHRFFLLLPVASIFSLALLKLRQKTSPLEV